MMNFFFLIPPSLRVMLEFFLIYQKWPIKLNTSKVKRLHSANFLPSYETF